MDSKLYRHLTKEYTEMENKHMKRESTSCVVQEIQLKPTARYYYMLSLEVPKGSQATCSV